MSLFSTCARRTRPPASEATRTSSFTPAFTSASSQNIREQLSCKLAPWSVLKISGLPCLVSAFSNVSTQNDASIVIDIRHDNTRRENQSTTAARYTKPRAIGIYVTFIAHT